MTDPSSTEPHPHTIVGKHPAKRKRVPNPFGHRGFNWHKAKWDPAEFLKAYLAKGSQVNACEEIGISMTTVARARRQDPEFATALAEVRDVLDECLDDGAMNRATWGTVEPIIECVGSVKSIDDNGREVVVRRWQQVGERRKWHDSLTIFMLKARRPQTYAPEAVAKRALEDGNDQFRLDAQVDLRSLSDEGREALATFLREQEKAEKLSDQAVAAEMSAEHDAVSETDKA